MCSSLRTVNHNTTRIADHLGHLVNTLDKIGRYTFRIIMALILVIGGIFGVTKFITP